MSELKIDELLGALENESNESIMELTNGQKSKNIKTMLSTQFKYLGGHIKNIR